MANKFEVSTIFKGIDRMSAPLRRITNNMRTMTRRGVQGMRQLRRSTDKALAGIKSMAQKAAVAGAIAAAGLGQAAAAGIDFEQSIVSAAAKFPGEVRRGTEAFADLEKAARETGATTEFSATQSAKALNFLAMAGFNAEQSISALPGVVDLATAAQVDLAQATDIASDTLGAFNLMAEDSTQRTRNLARVNDVLAKTVTTSNTDMQKLFETLRKGGPVAIAAGASIETVAAIAGTMANAGIKAELAGTAIQNAFLNLSKPSTNAQKVIRRLGLQLTDATGKLRDMPDIIDQVNAATRDLSTTQRQAAIETLFGREGLAGNMAVIAAGGDALREYRERLQGATGAASDMAGVMRDTTRGSINSLRSAIEGVSITLFETNRGPMRDAIDLATEWVRANGDIIAQNIGQFFLDLAANIDTVITSLKTIGIVVGTIWALNTALKAVEVTMALVSFFTTGVIGPFVLVGAAIAGLIIFVDDLLEAFDKMPAVLQIAFKPFQWLLKAIRFIKDNIGVVFDAVRGIGDFFGLTEPGDTPGGAQPIPEPVVSPQERVARSVTETTTTSTNEVIIKDETGRAQVRNLRGPQTLQVAQTGGFN